jgi:hypothetical protein
VDFSKVIDRENEAEYRRQMQRYMYSRLEMTYKLAGRFLLDDILSELKNEIRPYIEVPRDLAYLERHKRVIEQKK